MSSIVVCLKIKSVTNMFSCMMLALIIFMGIIIIFQDGYQLSFTGCLAYYTCDLRHG